MEVEESDNDGMYKKIQSLSPAAKLLLFAAVYHREVYPTTDIAFSSLKKYCGEDCNELGSSLVYLIGTLEWAGLLVVSKTFNGIGMVTDSKYTAKAELRDMEAVIGKDFYKEGLYKQILDRVNSAVAAAPLQQQKNSANGMNRKQPTNRNRNEPIDEEEKDNTSSLQRTTATTSNENGTTIERRPTNSMANTSAVASAAATESSPVNNAATAAAKRVSLSPDTTKKDLPTKRSNRVSKGNDDQVDKKKTPVDQDKVHEKKISVIYYDYLKKERGWEYRSGDLEAWTFFPGSILKKKIKPGSVDIYPDNLFEKYTAGEIKKKGIQGTHWANGWKELGEMISTHGYNFAPTSLKDVTKLDKKVSIQEIYDDLFVEDEEKVGGKKKSGSSASAAASTTAAAPVATAKSKAATRGECMSFHVVVSSAMIAHLHIHILLLNSQNVMKLLLLEELLLARPLPLPEQKQVQVDRLD